MYTPSKRDLRTIDDLMNFIEAPEPDWSRINLLGLDLLAPDLDDALLKQEFHSHTAFLGCLMSAALARKVVAAGALVVPGRPSLPFNPFRSSVYRAADLLKGYVKGDADSYLKTPDWRCYLAAMNKNTKRKRDDLGLDDAVFLRLHDLAIEDALDEYLRPWAGPSPKNKRVVGIMGGHASCPPTRPPSTPIAPSTWSGSWRKMDSST